MLVNNSKIAYILLKHMHLDQCWKTIVGSSGGKELACRQNCLGFKPWQIHFAFYVPNFIGSDVACPRVNGHCDQPLSPYIALPVHKLVIHTRPWT